LEHSERSENDDATECRAFDDDSTKVQPVYTIIEFELHLTMDNVLIWTGINHKLLLFCRKLRRQQSASEHLSFIDVSTSQCHPINHIVIFRQTPPHHHPPLLHHRLFIYLMIEW
jgi:hypothetical protein